jgi:hypothetical protein
MVIPPLVAAAERGRPRLTAPSAVTSVFSFYAPLTALVAADRATTLAAARRRSPLDVALRSALCVRAIRH